MSPILLAVLRRAGLVLATGVSTTLATFTQVQRWQPALIAGGSASASLTIFYLGGAGVVSMVKGPAK